MACFATLPKDITDFVVIPDGGTRKPKGKLTVETQSGDDITGHRVDASPKEFFAGKCRPGIDGTTQVISFVIMMDNAIYFFSGASQGGQIHGAYYVIAKVGRTPVIAADGGPGEDTGDTGSWGGSVT